MLPGINRSAFPLLSRYDSDLDRAIRFSAACALYWYCGDYHGGQWSDLYAMQCMLGYQPSMTESGPEPDSTDALYYSDLETKLIDPEALFDEIQALGKELDALDID